MGIYIASENDGRVREIEGWCSDVEDSDNSESGPDSNEIESDREEHDEPDSVDWSLSVGVNFRPESEELSVRAQIEIGGLHTLKMAKLHHEKMHMPCEYLPASLNNL